ncbi:MAG TPA: hypothetical protein VKB28_14440 [Solirubrobacteraceae bacterium]|nr:hypothetical protein [Solirubrobacteraceae bacterium]
MPSPIRARRPGATRSTGRRAPAATPRLRPSARRAPLRRAHLLEQEVTLAYLRELAQH